MAALQPHVRTAWIEALSAGRFATYIQAVDGDEERALRLYKWNGLLAGAWTPLLGLVEVALRNAIHDSIAHGTGRDDWWNIVRLDTVSTRNFAAAEQDLRLSRGATPAPARIVAELSLGNWFRLLGRGGYGIDYTKTLWRPFLSTRFTTAVDRRTMHDQAENLRKFRNRIAHHEHLLAIDHHRRLAEIASFAAIISTVVANELHTDPTIRNVLNYRP